jgi:hypothetical protein
MKNYKTIILIVLNAILVTSCDDKISSLENLNKAPVLEYFSRNTTKWTNVQGVIVDSAKVFNEKNNANYSIALRSKDINNNFENITITDVVNGGSFFLNEELFQDERIVELDSFSLSYRFFSKDIRLFTVKTADDFGKFENVNFEIHFLNNIPPTALFEIRNENVSGIIEHTIDGSFSKDGDFSRGGFIINYEFSINGIIINSASSEIKHIFNRGTQNVGLRVQDNDGVFSEQIFISFLN